MAGLLVLAIFTGALVYQLRAKGQPEVWALVGLVLPPIMGFALGQLTAVAVDPTLGRVGTLGGALLGALVAARIVGRATEPDMVDHEDDWRIPDLDEDGPVPPRGLERSNPIDKDNHGPRDNETSASAQSTADMADLHVVYVTSRVSRLRWSPLRSRTRACPRPFITSTLRVWSAPVHA